MTNAERMYVFGPVPSRRLGRSLGVDVVPFKTCSFDCIYCQLGRTTRLTCARGRHVPISDVIEQLKQTLQGDTQPDYITLSGSGEPTLNSDLGELIARIKKCTDIPVAVLTNGSLLWNEAVREDLLGADLIVPSLDAGTPEVFRHVNRPHPELDFGRVVEGMAEFRRSYHGWVWLEVFLLKGVNSMHAEVMKIKEYVDSIRPDKIQLNTVVRPAAEDFAHPVSRGQIAEIRDLFGERAEVIIPYEKVHSTQEGEVVADKLMAVLQRRPCTLEDIASGLGIHRNEAIKHLTKLEEENSVRQVRRDGRLYYAVTEKAPKRLLDSRARADLMGA